MSYIDELHTYCVYTDRGALEVVLRSTGPQGDEYLARADRGEIPMDWNFPDRAKEACCEIVEINPTT